jgi:2,3-bisphosphoglycerate-independent phosphoglycerate mutase
MISLPLKEAALKRIILLGDGMADEPIEELGSRTPLEVARTPFIDRLASEGELGMVRTVRAGFPPGSDIANMTVLGLDPEKYYTGRAPIEAVSMNVNLTEDDTAFRINLVTISPSGDGLVMEDYCSDHITTEEASELIMHLKGIVKDNPAIEMYPGFEYRHLMVIHGYDHPGLKTTPPHDIMDKQVEKYLPDDRLLTDLMKASMEALKDHPVNLERRRKGKREATSLWPWGEGKARKVPTLQEEYGVSGAMISAVDLLKGLGRLRGMEVILVPGATGWIDTNYSGKAQAALDALSRHELVYVHVEAPDESGHGGLLKEKIRSIEDFDRLVVGRVLTGLEALGEPFRLLVLPDHPTPVAKRTHTGDPVPYILYDSAVRKSTGRKYSEKQARDSGIFMEQGYTLLAKLLG